MRGVIYGGASFYRGILGCGPAHCLLCGDGFMNTYMSTLMKLHILNMCSRSIVPQNSF